MIFTQNEYNKLKEKIQLLQKKLKNLSKEKENYSNSGSYLAKTPGYLELQTYIFNTEEEFLLLKDQLAEAKIVDIERLPKEVVSVYSQVTIKDQKTGQECCYWIKNLPETIGPENENNRILEVSPKTPIAIALLGKKVGDKIFIKLPTKILEVEIKIIFNKD